jgi:hypothetical protein
MTRHVIIPIVLTAAITLSQNVARGEIPLPAGQYSITAQGSVTACVNPDTLQQEPCGTAGELIVPVNIVRIGVDILDQQGNFCISAADVETPNLPPLYPIVVPPIVTTDLHVTGKVLDYDPLTGTGDNTFTTYNGGTCTEATFNSTGATQVASGYDHFVVTENGHRFDGIATKITNPTNSIAEFSYSGTGLRQQ